MSSKLSVLAFAGLLAGSVSAGFAPNTLWDTDPNSSVSPQMTYIQTTIEVPALSEQGVLLWPGIYTDNGYLEQTLITNDPQYLPAYCGTNDNGWCIVAYTYTGQDGQTSSSDPTGYLASPGDLVQITYQQSGSNWTQTATLNGNVIVSLDWAGGVGIHLADTIECHSNVSATPQHTYYNTTITLNAANPDFNTTLSADNATPTSFGGTTDYITWFIDEITLNVDTCTA